MKRRICLMLMAVAAFMFVLPASAFDLGDVRVNARFLTDRMAFELKLNQRQYNDLYEINFDFFNNVDPYVSALSRAEARAMDAYYRYLDERNDDLRWVLPSAAYVKFMSIDYFFRPIYAVNNVCYVRVYKVYPDRRFFYYGLPVHYYSYKGAHGRVHCGGVSYYKKNFKKHYNHKVYVGHYQCRPEYRPHDFGRPNPAVRPSRPVCPPAKPLPPAKPVRPNKPVPPSATRPPKHDHDKHDRYERHENRKEVRKSKERIDRSSTRKSRDVSSRSVREL